MCDVSNWAGCGLMEIRFVFASASPTGFISYFIWCVDVRLMDPAIIVFWFKLSWGLWWRGSSICFIPYDTEKVIGSLYWFLCWNNARIRHNKFGLIFHWFWCSNPKSLHEAVLYQSQKIQVLPFKNDVALVITSIKTTLTQSCVDTTRTHKQLVLPNIGIILFQLILSLYRGILNENANFGYFHHPIKISSLCYRWFFKSCEKVPHMWSQWWNDHHLMILGVRGTSEDRVHSDLKSLRYDWVLTLLHHAPHTLYL